MAVVRLGGGVAAASGSAGGIVFSRNRSGPYIRNRSMPVNPGSVFQQNVRFALASLSARWVEVLTAAQRASWEQYALQVPLPGPLGDPRNVGGIGMFQRSNTPRVAFPDPTPTNIDDAPTLFDLGTFTPITPATASESTQQITILFTNTDDWANEDGAVMYVYASRPKNPSINFFKGPYRKAGFVLGNGTTPPTSPLTFDAPFPFVVGHKIFLRVNVSRADGRLASSFRDELTATA